MQNDVPEPVADRIERALRRIETAAAGRDTAMRALAERHQALRARMGEAIEALDAAIGKETV
ncbi:MAG: hypothetical protein B7Y45_09490 [Sphingomonas sp. 28-66-16]|nr:MAG: hypothetical protein B7Y45_09490 [Sphingomonas sp. 28-66-16]